MKVLVLFDLGRPAGPGETFSALTLKQQEDKPTEADVICALQRLGHEVDTLAVYNDVSAIIERIQSFAPDVVFNLTESFHDDRAHEANIPALLELLKVRYTGAGPEALMLCKDKALAKAVLVFHRVRVPHFTSSYPKHPLRRLHRFRYPAFVKPACEESSDGICQSSFVRNEQEALERLRFIHEKFQCPAMVEEYIDGRELYLSVLGNHRVTALPVREMFFDQVGQEAPKIATYKAKWDDAYRNKWGIRNGPAAELPPGVEQKLIKLARNVYLHLKIRGLGRMDVRLTPEGEVVFLEANPNPSLAQEDDFAQAALAAGIEYDALIQRILHAA